MENNTNSVINALLPLVEVLEQLEIFYYIGGSVASSAHGVSRPTQDADVVADIQLKHVQALVRLLKNDYYIDADAIRGAISHRSSFNIIHLASMFKVDIFIPKSRQFAQQERLRAQPAIIEEGIRLSMSHPQRISF